MVNKTKQECDWCGFEESNLIKTNKGLLCKHCIKALEDCSEEVIILEGEE